MNLLLRTLEDWTTHQDYLWFLAALAWVAAAAACKITRTGFGETGWLAVWALANGICAAAQLALLTRHYEPGAYPAWDIILSALLGFSAFLLAGAAWHPWMRGSRLRLTGLFLIVVALVVTRNVWPVAGGLALVLLIALAARVLAGGGTGRSYVQASQPALALFVLWALFAPHGPVAYAVGRGTFEDFSHFALAGSALLAASGLFFATAAWRMRLSELESSTGSAVQSGPRRHLRILMVWLLAGFGLMVLSGRLARQDFEETLLSRARTALLSIDGKIAARALREAMKGGALETFLTRKGNPAERMMAAGLDRDDLAILCDQLNRIKNTNTDLKFVHLATVAERRIVYVTTANKEYPRSRWLLAPRAADAGDSAALTGGTAEIIGPANSIYGSLVSARSPVLDPQTPETVGWLILEVASSRWLAAFSQARLQTLALVGIGVLLWALAVAYDLRRTTAEATARRAAAATEADRLKSEFLAMVSHELRTPIQSVLGYGELLATETLSADGTRWVGALQTHGQIMLRLVNDLIDIGALQSGSFRLHPRETDLRGVVEESVAMMRPRALPKGLSLHCEFLDPLPQRVTCDPIRLRQILLNLLANAVKFTTAGEVRVRIRALPDEPGANTAASIEFTVSDTGPGVPPERRSELFLLFRRGDARPDIEGAGLGLALVAGLCRSMGGAVRYAAGSGPGAVFVVTLPLPEAGAVAPRSVAAGGRLGTPAWAGVRILVAEDNTLVRELLVDFLVRQGADVSAVADGDSTLGRASAEHFDVILLDWMMPSRDGLSVTRLLRARGGPPDRPFIIGLSAHAGSNAFPSAYEAGMNAFLPKPVNLASLAHVIQRAPGVPALPEQPAPDGASLAATLQVQFAQELPDLVASLTRAAELGDAEAFRSRAHYLKNSADIVQAELLSAECLAALALPAAVDRATLRAQARRITAAAQSPFRDSQTST